MKTTIPATSIGQQKGPSSPQQQLTTLRTTNASKVERIVLQTFAYSAHLKHNRALVTVFYGTETPNVEMY